MKCTTFHVFCEERSNKFVFCSFKRYKTISICAHNKTQLKTKTKIVIFSTENKNENDVLCSLSSLTRKKLIFFPISGSIGLRHCAEHRTLDIYEYLNRKYDLKILIFFFSCIFVEKKSEHSTFTYDVM